jgi:hypothetical protein
MRAFPLTPTSLSCILAKVKNHYPSHERETAMHSAICPTCNQSVETDFLPVAGLVWCPTCQKTFSPRTTSEPDSEETESNKLHEDRNGK